MCQALCHGKHSEMRLWAATVGDLAPRVNFLPVAALIFEESFFQLIVFLILPKNFFSHIPVTGK